jgi:cell division protein FtsA
VVVKGELDNVEAASGVLNRALGQLDEYSSNQLLRSQLMTLVFTGGGVRCEKGIGSVNICNPEGIVGEKEIDEAYTKAGNIEKDVAWKDIHTTPISWKLDGRKVGQPFKQRGRLLELTALIVLGHLTEMGNLENVVRGSELAAMDLYHAYAAVCAKEGCVSEMELNDGVIMIDLGAGCADYLTAWSGGIHDAGTLKVGFNHVANDLSVGLKLPFVTCQKLFEDGTLKRALEENWKVLPIKQSIGSPREIKLSSFETIIAARLEEIFEEVKKKVDLPGGRTGILTGGGALYPPTLDIFSKVFGISCRVGSVADASGSITDLASPRYSAVWGALKIAAHYQRTLPGSQGGIVSSAVDVMNNIWVYLPRSLAKLWKAFKF